MQQIYCKCLYFRMFFFLRILGFQLLASSWIREAATEGSLNSRNIRCCLSRMLPELIDHYFCADIFRKCNRMMFSTLQKFVAYQH